MTWNLSFSEFLLHIISWGGAWDVADVVYKLVNGCPSFSFPPQCCIKQSHRARGEPAAMSVCIVHCYK